MRGYRNENGSHGNHLNTHCYNTVTTMMVICYYFYLSKTSLKFLKDLVDPTLRQIWYTPLRTPYKVSSSQALLIVRYSDQSVRGNRLIKEQINNTKVEKYLGLNLIQLLIFKGNTITSSEGGFYCWKLLRLNFVIH